MYGFMAKPEISTLNICQILMRFNVLFLMISYVTCCFVVCCTCQKYLKWYLSIFYYVPKVGLLPTPLKICSGRRNKKLLMKVLNIFVLLFLMIQLCAKNIENFIFRLKMAIFRRAGMREGGLPPGPH
jgi:hypothetical protein